MKDLYKSLTITIVLFKENFELISKCLDKIKNFNIILIDNDGNTYLKKKLRKNTIFKNIS